MKVNGIEGGAVKAQPIDIDSFGVSGVAPDLGRFDCDRTDQPESDSPRVMEAQPPHQNAETYSKWPGLQIRRRSIVQYPSCQT